MTPIYTAGSFDTAIREGPLLKIPFGPNNTDYYVIQRCNCTWENWKQLPLNTVFDISDAGGNDLRMPGYYLVEESAPVDKSAGICAWERTYAPIFTEWVEPEQYTWKYPGLAGGSAGGSKGRAPGTLMAVNSRVYVRTFILGISQRDASPYTIVEDVDDIPEFTQLPIVDSSGFIRDTYDGAAATAITSLVASEFVGNYPDAKSGNTLTENDYWVDKVLATTFDAGKMVVDQSIFKHWKGYLYLRYTRYVKAQ